MEQSPLSSTNSYSPASALGSNVASSAPSTSAAGQDAVSSDATNSNTTAAATGKGTRRYNASCDNCRARKRKCSGKDPARDDPTCTTCRERGLQCTYGSLGEPSRLRRADLENQKLKAIISELAGAKTEEERRSVLETIEVDIHGSAKGLGASQPGPSYVSSASSSRKGKEKATGHQPTKKRKKEGSPPISDNPSQRIELKPKLHSPSTSQESADFPTAAISSEYRDVDGSDEIMERMYGYLYSILPDGPSQGGPTFEGQEQLFSYYFCWLNPRYSILDEDLLRGSILLSDSRFCSSFLLWCLYTHTASHCPGFLNRRKEFRARAHLLLSLEMASNRISTLTTGQGIVLLAGSAAAEGNHSQAWVLTHTAISITRELIDSIHEATPEEAQMRRRLYWATYIWSIILALNLNRRPPLRRLKIDPPEGNEECLWRPVLPVKIDDDYTATSLFSVPEQKSFELSCTRESCMLYGFLDDILQKVYGAPKENPRLDEIHKAVKDIRDNMIAWQSRLPRHLLLDTDALPSLAPPPHIIHLNLLIRSTWILLYRPFYHTSSMRSPIAGARAACDECAKEIHAIFVLFEQTYGVLRHTYIYIYAAFWAATVDVAHARREGLREDLLKRLSYSSRILLSWVTVPGMRQSVSQLVGQIEDLLLPQTSAEPESKEGLLQEAAVSANGQNGADSAAVVAIDPALLPPPQSAFDAIGLGNMPDVDFPLAMPHCYGSTDETYWTLPSWTFW